MTAPSMKPPMVQTAVPVSNASSIRSKVRADTSTPAPNATMAATTRRGGSVVSPMAVPTMKPELAIRPWSRAVSMQVWQKKRLRFRTRRTLLNA